MKIKATTSGKPSPQAAVAFARLLAKAVAKRPVLKDVKQKAA